MKYNITCKHYLLGQGENEVFMQVDFDTTVGTGKFGVCSNKRFTDDGEVYGFAVGVGETEEEAFLMCLKELEE